MKSLLVILLSLVANCLSFGQITTTKVAQKVEQPTKVAYDSTKNFVGKDVYQYIGQELYVNPLAESLRKYGYNHFAIDYSKNTLGNKSNVYKCCDSYNSKYDELVGKYFIVLEVIKHPKAEDPLYSDKFYLKLEEKEKKDIVYYEYDSRFEFSFPFTVVGYFTKLKTTEIGKEFIVRGKNWLSSGAMTDINSGLPVSNFEAGKKWKCIDITIEERFYTLSLILENEKGERIPISVENTKHINWVFGSEQAETYKKQFGVDDWQRILNGKVRIGMSKEMCEMSWGKPKKINQTITSGTMSEQWVYPENYLYFENDILTTIQ